MFSQWLINMTYGSPILYPYTCINALLVGDINQWWRFQRPYIFLDPERLPFYHPREPEIEIFQPLVKLSAASFSHIQCFLSTSIARFSVMLQTISNYCDALPFRSPGFDWLASSPHYRSSPRDVRSCNGSSGRGKSRTVLYD